MSILSLILALALEQLRPISSRNRLYLAFVRVANKLERSTNAGEQGNGIVAWLMAVVPLAVISLAGYWLLYQAHALLAVLWSAAILYLTMGFRQFSHAFTRISKALKEEDLPGARTLLGDWMGQPASELTEEEVARLTIEQGVIDSYRYVFAMMFWFVVLAWVAGPTGALIYRAACLLQQKWCRPGNDRFGAFANAVVQVMDYIPARLTAVGFAVMGDFEDAVFCWRSQAEQWSHCDSGILLASAAGALGVKIGSAVHQDHTVKFRPELGVGEPANPDYLAGAVGLVWRSVLLWLFVIFMFSAVLWLSALLG